MISDEYDVIIANASELWNVPFTWIKAVIGTESDFQARAYRAEPQINDGSYGLMQLLYKTARGLGYEGPAEGLFDVGTNIDLGTQLLAQLRSRFGDDFARVYSAYNSGSPTAYLTNTSVRAHVDRALSYLHQVESSVTQVEGTTGETGAVSAGLLIFVAAIGYFLWRQFS